MLDLLILLYLFWQTAIALKMPPSVQLGKLLLRVFIISTLSGFFILIQLTGLIRASIEQLTASSGILLSLASLITAILLLMQLKSRFVDRFDEWLPARYLVITSVSLALVRGLLMSAVMLFVLAHFPLGLFDQLLESSRLFKLTGLSTSSE